MATAASSPPSLLLLEDFKSGIFSVGGVDSLWGTGSINRDKVRCIVEAVFLWQQKVICRNKQFSV